MNSTLKQLEDTLELYFVKKAPALPMNFKDILVKIAPYLVIISLILTIPAILLLLGLGGVTTMMAPAGGSNAVAMLPNMWIGIVLLIPVVILDAMAVPGLFARKAIGWKYIFWAQLLGVVSSLIQFNIVGGIIGAIIGFYILFQIKSHYK